jgi:putative ABC transport system permease protein
VLTFALIIVGVIAVALIALVPLFLLLFAGERLLGIVQFGRPSRFLLIAFKSLQRNLLRTSLTYLASFVLVVVVVMVFSVLYYLDILTKEKSKDLKLIITEKYQANSKMPFSYARPLSEGAADARRPPEVKPQDHMTWQTYLGTLDAIKNTRESMIPIIGMEPRKMLTVMESVFNDFAMGEAEHKGAKPREQVEMLNAVVAEMERNKKAIIVGRKCMEAMNKRVGDSITVTGINYTGLDLEFQIVGEFPPGRYDQIAVMNRDYLNDALDAYPKTHGNQKHPLADRSLNMVWLQVPDLPAYGRIAEQIDESGIFADPSVKCETLSSGVNTWIEGFQDLFWAMRWLLAPAILFTMILVIANAISISVRERRKEMAVLKVLGYRPAQILGLVLGEAVIIGAISGFLSAILTWLAVNHAPHAPQSFEIWVPDRALWWGPALGALTALVGSVVPAWNACKIRVSEVFARTA